MAAPLGNRVGMKLTQKIRWLMMLLMIAISSTLAQYASNGQQLLVVGVRLHALEIEGLNHDHKPAHWWTDQIPKRGQTMIWVKDWWWNNTVTIRAKLENNRKLECKAGPFHQGTQTGSKRCAAAWRRVDHQLHFT